MIPVWIDRQNLPPKGDELVDRAMKTWTTAADGAFTLRRTLLANDAGIRIYFNGAGGNYGEIFERNVGKSSPLKLDRGLNATWAKGGLMYALPFK